MPFTVLTKTLLMVKLTAILLTIACLQVNARSYSQTISFSGKAVPVTKVFEAIKRQAGYVFFYDGALLQNAKRVTLDVKNASVEEVLNACLKGQSLDYSIEKKTITVIPKEPAVNPLPAAGPLPPVDIHGTVLNNQGQPMANVSVQVKGTSAGTTTDNRGTFSIKAGAGDILVFSSVGYASQEVTVDKQTDIRLTLHEAVSNLQQVVVVAYGRQKKIDLTGSVDQISGDMLQNRPVTNVGDALQGMMANLNITTGYSGGAPNATKNINIRGYTGFNGSLASPLILVDGVEANLNSINPNDIESVSMLKDVASSSIYGSRAPNGVLLITTRQGRKGQPFTLSYNNNFSYSQPMNVPKMANSLIWANTVNEAYTNAGQQGFIPDDVIARITAYINDPKNTPTTIAAPNGLSWGTYDNIFGNADNDWYKIYLKKWSPGQQHNLSISGGSDKLTYFIGMGTQDQNGLYNFYNDYYKRDNLRANLTADINKYITVSLKTFYAQENTNNPIVNGGIGSNWFYQIPRIWPIVPLYDPNGGLEANSQVPLMQSGGANTTRNNDSRITGDVTIRPLKGWDIVGQYSYNYQSYNAASTVLPFYSSTPQSPQTLNTSIISSVNEQVALTNYYTYNIFTSYERTIKDHYFKVLLGQQLENKSYSTLTGANSNLYNTSQPSLALSSGTASATDAGGYDWATYGTFGRINYNYKDKYLLEANGRYMGTSIFPSDTRYHLFSSASAGWNISREAFFAPLRRWIDNLKFRASYGVLGDISSYINAAPPNVYPYLANLGATASTGSSWLFTPAGGRQPYVSPPGNLISPTLTWPKPSMLDIGADIDFLKDFNLTYDWYKKKITDQIGPAGTYESVLGVTAPQMNDEVSQTVGWDLTVSWKHTFGKVSLSARALLSTYSGKVVSYTGNPTDAIGAGTGSIYTGSKIGQIWGYVTKGKFQTPDQVNNAPSQNAINASGYQPGDIQYADLNHDGKIDYGTNTLQDRGDLTVIGNTTPKYAYGFNTSASWKGVDLSLFIQGVGHTDFTPGQNNLFWQFTSVYQSNIFTNFSDRWSPTNPNGYFPRLDAVNGAGKNYQVQSGYLLNAAYLRLKNLQLGYTVPKSSIQKWHLSQIRLYGSVDNLFTITSVFKHQYLDPEVLQSDEKIYPLQRTVSFGFQVGIQ
jgi:TonB-linked SusC/RagA family outer membrane protein